MECICLSDDLKWEGKTVEPGEKIRYFIDDYSQSSKRAIPVELAASNAGYDVKRYSRLDECCKSVTSPFLD